MLLRVQSLGNHSWKKNFFGSGWMEASEDPSLPAESQMLESHLFQDPLQTQPGPLIDAAFIATTCTYSTPIRSLAVCYGSKSSCYAIQMRGQRISWVILLQTPFSAHRCMTNHILVVCAVAWFVWVYYVGEGVRARFCGRDSLRQADECVCRLCRMPPPPKKKHNPVSACVWYLRLYSNRTSTVTSHKLNSGGAAKLKLHLHLNVVHQ